MSLLKAERLLLNLSGMWRISSLGLIRSVVIVKDKAIAISEIMAQNVFKGIAPKIFSKYVMCPDRSIGHMATELKNGQNILPESSICIANMPKFKAKKDAPNKIKNIYLDFLLKFIFLLYLLYSIFSTHFG